MAHPPHRPPDDLPSKSPPGDSPPFLGLFLERVALGPRQARKSLTLWPLVLRPGVRESTAPCYVALADALGAGVFAIDELDESGRVPHVRATNRGASGVLVLFGEELVGAKQNRVANASFLVAPGSEVVLDVSCVEAGRWSRRPGHRFASANAVASALLRRKMEPSVRAMRQAGLGFHADQAEVWEEIDQRMRRSGTRSPTRAYADYVRRHASEVEDFVSAFHRVPHQVGFAVSLGDRVMGLEAIGRPEVFARQFVELLRSYAIDAADAALWRDGEHERGGSERRFEAPEPFLAALAQARVARRPSLGLGEDLRIEGEGVSGCALAAGDLVHLTAFPATQS